MRARAPQRGFTMIELLVVMGLVALLATLALSTGDKSTGNPRNTAQTINSTLSFARLRAISTRRIHRVKVEPNVISVWVDACTNCGFTTPTSYELIESAAIPSGTVVWDATCQVPTCSSNTIFKTPGANPTQNTSLNADFDFRPDGSSTGGTIFVTDPQGMDRHRVLVYRATGSSYTRDAW